MATKPPLKTPAPEARDSAVSAKRWVIGRDPQCDLIVDAQGVSSRHCLLTRSGEDYLLEDLGSTNGTFVNGERITTRVAVTVKDQITLGVKAPMPWPKAQAAAPKAAVATPKTPATKEVAATTKVPAAPSGNSKSMQRIRIGRTPDNDVTLDYPMVSSHHAELIVQDGQAEITDLGSSNGTAIGHPNKKISKAPLTPNDTVFFGSLRVPAGQLFKALKPGGREKDNVVTVKGDAIVFGRAPSCEHVLNFPMISSRHARLSRQSGQMVIEDLGSSNGTFVNGTRIYRRTAVKAGDVIGLGSFTFTLNDAGNLQKRDFRGHITLEAREVVVEVPKKRLLDPISLTIYPSELVALMGPSGAGKTTLLSALNGYTPPTDGDIFLNGENLYERYDQFRTCMGYVPQEDVMHRDLTVGQALYYTARLRLPSDYSQADIKARIAQVIEQLGLQGTENVLIGSAERKGISGGQRKRVNLAMELLTDPLILFLDEPTSGLSSEDALMVMQLLRKLADEGKTILISIHQPSLEVFRLMDNLVVVGRDAGASKEPGELVYYGPAYPEAVHFFNPDGIPGQTPGAEPSPDEVLRGLKKQPVAYWTEKYAASEFHREYVAERASNVPSSEAPRGAFAKSNSAPLSQWTALFHRGLARKVKDRVNTCLLLAQAPIIAILLVGVFGNQLKDGNVNDGKDWMLMSRGVSTCVFQLIVASLWFGCSNAVREIVGEWAIYHRERMVNLKLLPYVAFKFAILGGLCLLQCAVLLGIVRWGCGLKGPFLPMFGVMVLVSVTGVALGLVMSAAARTQEIAMALLPVVALTMAVLGGGMQPVHKLHSTMRVAAHAVPSRWAFESMILLEAESQAKSPPPPVLPPMPPGQKMPTSSQMEHKEEDMAEYHFPAEEHRGKVWHGVLALSILFTILVASLFGILRLRDVH